MQELLGSIFRFSAAAAFVFPGALAASEEPTTFRTTNYFTATPETLSGAKVVNAEELGKLLDSSAPVLIDVTPAARRPQGFPEDRLWHVAKRRTISGGVWLPNVGYGWLSHDFEHFFKTELETLTNGDMKQQLVFYCLPDCWQSWNAALRALNFGYTNVVWFPGGSPEWEVFSYPLEFKRPLAMPDYGSFK